MGRITAGGFFNRTIGEHTERGGDPILSRLTVVEIGEIDSDREVTIDIELIRYLCTGQAILDDRIEARWIAKGRIRPKAIYVRTADRLYCTSSLGFAELLERLPGNFEKVNHGVVVNDKWIGLPELRRQHHKRVGMRVAGRPDESPVEWVSVSRRHVATVRDRIGMGRPRRTSRVVNRPRTTSPEAP